MTLKEAYIEHRRACLYKGLHCESGHYQTEIKFGKDNVYVSPDGEDVIRYVFPVTGCLKTRKIEKNGKVVKVLHFHKDRLPVYGTITKRKAVRGFIFKYLLFLRCDGIEDRDLLKLYVLHCLTNKFEFWRRAEISKMEGEQILITYGDWELYEPEYSDIEKMIEGLIDSSIKRDIDNETREQFIIRRRCVVNPDVKDSIGGIRDKTKWEKNRDVRKGLRIATDNRIRALFDPNLKDKENAQKIGVSVRRLQEWKAENVESLEEKIKRLYDPSLSQNKNAKIIGCSPNSIKKYIDIPNIIPVEDKNSEEDWIEKVIEEESSFWKDAPAVSRKNSDAYEEILELMKDIE